MNDVVLGQEFEGSGNLQDYQSELVLVFTDPLGERLMSDLILGYEYLIYFLSVDPFAF